MPAPRPWPVVCSTPVADHRIFAVRRDRAVSPRTGEEHAFIVLETPDWVNVVPVTRDGDAVLVRQYRHGLRQLTLEIPGGMVDADDRDPAESVRRELLEETGYAPDELVPLGWVHPQPAFQTNRCHTYLALGCRRVAEPSPDAGEDLEVVLVPVDELQDRVAGGEITHGLVLAALYRYELWRRENP